MRLLFTINGLPAGRTLKSPVGANDVHFQWAGGRGQWIEIVILTIDGKVAGVVWPPPGANDIDFAWSTTKNGAYSFTGAYWTRDGEPIGPIPLPKGANDAHFKIIPLPGGIGPTIVNAWWTQNGKKLRPIRVPAGANDFHLW